MEDGRFKIAQFGEYYVVQQGIPSLEHPTVQDEKIVHCNPSSNPHYQRMALPNLLKMLIVKKVDLTPPSEGKIYVVDHHDSIIHSKYYHMTISKYPKCSCAFFLKMHNSIISG